MNEVCIAQQRDQFTHIGQRPAVGNAEGGRRLPRDLADRPRTIAQAPDEGSGVIEEMRLACALIVQNQFIVKWMGRDRRARARSGRAGAEMLQDRGCGCEHHQLPPGAQGFFVLAGFGAVDGGAAGGFVAGGAVGFGVGVGGAGVDVAAGAFVGATTGVGCAAGAVAVGGGSGMPSAGPAGGAVGEGSGASLDGAWPGGAVNGALVVVFVRGVGGAPV
jgi:hypothetical protein